MGDVGGVFDETENELLYFDPHPGVIISRFYLAFYPAMFSGICSAMLSDKCPDILPGILSSAYPASILTFFLAWRVTRIYCMWAFRHGLRDRP